METEINWYIKATNENQMEIDTLVDMIGRDWLAEPSSNSQIFTEVSPANNVVTQGKHKIDWHNQLYLLSIFHLR